MESLRSCYCRGSQEAGLTSKPRVSGPGEGKQQEGEEAEGGGGVEAPAAGGHPGGLRRGALLHQHHLVPHRRHLRHRPWRPLRALAPSLLLPPAAPLLLVLLLVIPLVAPLLL